MRLANFKNRVNIIVQKIDKKSIDKDVLIYLKPLADTLDISVEELALNLHIQKFYIFDNIEDVLDLEEYND